MHDADDYKYNAEMNYVLTWANSISVNMSRDSLLIINR